MKGRAKFRFDKIMTEQVATTVSTTKARRDQNLYGLSVHLNLVLLRTHFGQQRRRKQKFKKAL